MIVPRRLHITVDPRAKTAQLRTEGWLAELPDNTMIVPVSGNVLAGPEPESFIIVIQLGPSPTIKPRVDPQIIVP